MAVYVDNYKGHFCGMVMSHMTADTLEELHDMAKKIGLKRSWFQNHKKYPHYDVSQSKRKEAIEMGAIEESAHDMIRRMRR